MPRSKNEIGILLSSAGYLSWVFGDALVKLAAESLPTAEILTLNFLVGIGFFLILSALNGGCGQLKSSRPWYQLALSILVITATISATLGLIYLTLADFYTIVFTSPLIMTILGWLFLKERPDSKAWLATIVGFAGIIVAIRFSGGAAAGLSWTGIAVTSLCA